MFRGLLAWNYNFFQYWVKSNVYWKKKFDDLFWPDFFFSKSFDWTIECNPMKESVKNQLESASDFGR